MKRKLGFVCALLFAVLCTAGAFAADERVFDSADLFSSSQERTLANEIAEFQEETGMDFVIVTSSQEHDGADQQTIADEFYDRGGFGLDDENSGILYYIDMNERIHYLSTTGKMIDYMTDERIESAIASCQPNLTSGDYAGAASRMIAIVTGYVRQGIPEGQYRYDVITGERLTARHNVLTMGEIIGSGVIALLVCVLVVVFVSRRYRLKGSTYHYDYQSNSTLHITDRVDDYLRTTTTQTRKADPPSGGGGSGGSGVHSSSSGTSHGGGGGRF